MRGREAHAMTRFLASCEGEGAMGICALQECVCVCPVFSLVSRLRPMPLKWNKDTFMNTPGIPGCDMAPLALAGSSSLFGETGKLLLHILL